jgi:hypothetical protein
MVPAISDLAVGIGAPVVQNDSEVVDVDDDVSALEKDKTQNVNIINKIAVPPEMLDTDIL